jgi:excinuclease UvrABC nuclease subunit
MVESAFSGVRGLGPRREKAIARAFPSLEKLAEASDEEILKAARLSPESLQELRDRAAQLLRRREPPADTDS